MFNGSRFFYLARKWKKENKDSNYLFILQDVMNHYFGSIVGERKPYELSIKGEYSIADISFVLDDIGYSDYSIENPDLAGNRIVILRKKL